MKILVAMAESRFAKAGVSTQTKLLHGASPADAILEAAKLTKAGMVVIGSKGKTSAPLPSRERPPCPADLCALVTLVVARFTFKRLASNSSEFSQIHEGV